MTGSPSSAARANGRLSAQGRPGVTTLNSPEGPAVRPAPRTPGARAVALRSMGTPDVRVRRVYEEPQPDDGTRVLVDRLWPRGVSKARAALDEWCKDVAPSDELRKWYGHDPGRFEEFGRRYGLELQGPRQAGALAHLRELAKDGRLTLLTATTRPEISEAAVLAALLEK